MTSYFDFLKILKYFYDKSFQTKEFNAFDVLCNWEDYASKIENKYKQFTNEINILNKLIEDKRINVFGYYNNLRMYGIDPTEDDVYPIDINKTYKDYKLSVFYQSVFNEEISQYRETVKIKATKGDQSVIFKSISIDVENFIQQYQNYKFVDIIPNYNLISYSNFIKLTRQLFCKKQGDNSTILLSLNIDTSETTPNSTTRYMKLTKKQTEETIQRLLDNRSIQVYGCSLEEGCSNIVNITFERENDHLYIKRHNNDIILEATNNSNITTTFNNIKIDFSEFTANYLNNKILNNIESFKEYYNHTYPNYAYSTNKKANIKVYHYLLEFIHQFFNTHENQIKKLNSLVKKEMNNRCVAECYDQDKQNEFKLKKTNNSNEKDEYFYSASNVFNYWVFYRFQHTIEMTDTSKIEKNSTSQNFLFIYYLYMRFIQNNEHININCSRNKILIEWDTWIKNEIEKEQNKTSPNNILVDLCNYSTRTYPSLDCVSNIIEAIIDLKIYLNFINQQ